MNISELKSKKLADLRDIARSLGLTGYSGLRKQDLIYLILETEAEVASTRREAALWLELQLRLRIQLDPHLAQLLHLNPAKDDQAGKTSKENF